MCDDKKIENKHAKKSLYDSTEKKIILDRLDEERRIHQQAMKGLDGKKAFYSEEEKKAILDRLNAQRLSAQKRQEIKEKRTANKEVYIFDNKKFYKFLNMEREYFIEVSACDTLSQRQSVIPLYYRTFEKLKHKEVLMKTEIYSDQFFISYDMIRVYFKGYSLEDKRTI